MFSPSRGRLSPARDSGSRYALEVVETAVALPEDLKAALDRRAPAGPARDELVPAALRAYLSRPGSGEDASDLAIINAHAAPLNAEAEDALSYQIPL